jgi:hypothetical protein
MSFALFSWIKMSVYSEIGKQSCVNLISLTIGLLPRVLAVGFNFDWIVTNVVWYKMRLYISQVSSFVFLLCICYALK